MFTLDLQLTTFSDPTRSRDLFKIGMFSLLNHLLHLLPGKSRRRRRGETSRMWRECAEKGEKVVVQNSPMQLYLTSLPSAFMRSTFNQIHNER